MVATHGHFFPLIGMNADRQINQVAIAIGLARDDCKIFLLDRPLLELIGERKMGLIGLGHDEHSARVAIEAMNDAGTSRAARAAEPIEMKLQGAGERAGPMPFGRVNDHARRLVDRGEPLVLEQNIERNILGLRRLARNLGKRQPDRFPEPKPMGGFRSRAVHFDARSVDRPAKLHPAMTGEFLREKEIQPLAD